jgi:predicted 2-oxoglutarate/Fe(II)-dependent dioxygenase YbiX
MQIIDHGHSIVEYRDAIENPYQVIANINELDSDRGVYDVLPQFTDWAEGYAQPDGVWRAVDTKGKNKIIRWSESRNREDLKQARELVSEKVLDPIWTPFKAAIDHYASFVGVPVPTYITKNIDIRVYATGENLGPHTDTNHSGPVTHRSLVIYLNDDYEGGGLHFIDHELIIKPKAGSIVAFPATTLHESLAVTVGNKWHSPCFWYGDVSVVSSGKEQLDPNRFME